MHETNDVHEVGFSVAPKQANALRVMEAKMIDAIHEAANENVPPGLILSILHTLAFQLTQKMCTETTP